MTWLLGAQAMDAVNVQLSGANTTSVSAHEEHSGHEEARIEPPRKNLTDEQPSRKKHHRPTTFYEVMQLHAKEEPPLATIFTQVKNSTVKAI